MSILIPNTVKFHKTEHSKKLRFHTFICFISSTATFIDSNKKASSLLNLIMKKEKGKYFFYNTLE